MVRQYRGTEDTETTTPITALVGTGFVITAVEFRDTKYGPMALVTVQNAETRYRTTSAVLVKQLYEVKAQIDEFNEEIGVELKERRSQEHDRTYYSF